MSIEKLKEIEETLIQTVAISIPSEALSAMWFDVKGIGASIICPGHA